MKEFRKRYWYKFALCASYISLIYSPLAYTADIEDEEIEASIQPDARVEKDTYTVNFNNVSMLELIRFASKITNLNFIFEEADLQFAVTVVSEEAVTAKSMMSVLSQVLRTHGLILLEQDGNVLITKSTNVNQIPPIVSSDLPESHAGNAALITQVFRIKNANITTIAGIIRPMTSQGALIEMSPETRQLIVTDITTNVEQIATLLLSLDAPHSPLDVETYIVKNISPRDLITLTEQILKPFAEGNPLIFVPQNDTNSVYIVSTPSLIERAMITMEDLDIPTKAILATRAGMASQVFVYKPKFTSQDQLLSAFHELVPSLEKSKTQADLNLVDAIRVMQWNEDTQTFLVISDEFTIDRLKGLFAAFDTAQSPLISSKGFFLYKLQNAPCKLVVDELLNLAQKLPPSLQRENLLTAIERIQCIPANNSLLLSGTNELIEQLKTLIADFDLSSMSGVAPGGASFLIYKPKYLPTAQLQSALTALAEDLQKSNLQDPQLFAVLSTMRFVPETNALLFTGSQQGLDKVQNLINTVDTSAALGAIQNVGNVTFFLYKVQSASPEKLIASLKSFASDLKQSNIADQQLAEAINSVKWIKETNSLLFTGPSSALEKVDQLVKKFDTGIEGIAHGERVAANFIIYNPKNVSGEELISILCNFMDNLMSSGVSDAGLFDTIENLRWIERTRSLLISGDQKSIDKVQQLLVKFDVPGKENALPSIESIENTSFLVYKLQFHPGNDIQQALQQVATSLGKGAAAPASLVDAIHSLQWIQVTNSLLCSGSQEVLVKLKDLIQNLDRPLRQVFIEVLVIQTNLVNVQNFGLQWGGQVQYFNKTVLQTGNFPTPPSAIAPGGSPAALFPSKLQGINTTSTPNNTTIPFSTGFDLGVIGDIIMHKGKSFISLGSLLNALQTDQDTTVILNPKIITQDNRQSTVFVGQNIPYAGSVVTNTGQNATVQNSNIEYRDIGVSLTITPILGDGDSVTLDIVQDISSLTPGSNTQLNNTQLTGITTNHTHMETRVNMPSNHFVALSGMINDQKQHYRTAIPCLGGLPVIGAIFSENDRSDQKQNIIIFVRPQIIDTSDQYKAVTEHQEWLFKDSARIRVLKEEFDEGLDMVKLPENE